MKRIMVFWLVLLLPFMVLASDYESKDINIKFNVNDDYIVLTRDNLENNPNLETINVNKDDMKNIMEKNNIYFDIVKKDISYEILVVVPKTTTQFSNLDNATPRELENIKNTIIKATGDKVPTVYKNNYSFIVVKYKDANGYNNINYYTVVNSRGYNIQLQKKTAITEDDEKALKEIIDSIEFEKKEEPNEEIKDDSNNKQSFDYKIIIYGLIIGVIAGLITYYFLTKKKK